MVLACESIFSRTSLDARPQNLHTFSKVNLKYIQRTFQVGQARYSFHFPFTHYLQILLAQGNRASTNAEHCPFMFKNYSRNWHPNFYYIWHWLKELKLSSLCWCYLFYTHSCMRNVYQILTNYTNSNVSHIFKFKYKTGITYPYPNCTGSINRWYTIHI